MNIAAESKPPPQSEAGPNEDTVQAAQSPPEPPENTSNFSRLMQGDSNGDEPTEKDQALVSLEGQLQAEKDARMEERFIWLVFSIVLIDVIWFKDASNSTAPIVVMVFELVALLVLARKMHVDEYVQVIGNVLHGIGRKGMD